VQGKFDEVYNLQKPLKETLMWGTGVRRRTWKVNNGCILRLEAGRIMKAVLYHLTEEEIRTRTG